MLVLTRKIGETITVGDPRGLEPPILITVLAVRGEVVDLAVEVPAGVPVEKKSPVESRRARRSEERFVKRGVRFEGL